MSIPEPVSRKACLKKSSILSEGTELGNTRKGFEGCSFQTLPRVEALYVHSVVLLGEK